MSVTSGHSPKLWRNLQRCRLSTCSKQQARGSRAVGKQKVQGPARTRFAPSPTGYLHLGSLRTALFNYLLAKSTGGQFLLRIEDTDQKRTLPDAEQRICRDLRWAGLQWDEGPEVGGSYGPYQQSKRTGLYRENAETLLKSGHAYRCFCTSQRLRELAEHRAKLGLPTDYDRACLSVSTAESDERAHKGETYVIRLKVPDRYPDFHDLVYGRVGQTPVNSASLKHGEPAYEDPVLLKSDGLPTYHLANVVDDHHMKITHVVRAAEWISSTPKHLAMYEAFQWQPPAYAHVGLLQNTDGQKLSKRNFDQDVSYFRDSLGILPEALTNYVALLGWSHGQKSDIFTLKQLVENFQVSFTKGNTIVTDYKLHFLQKAHAKRRAKEGGPEFDELVDRLHRLVQDHQGSHQGTILQGRDLKPYVAAILQANAKNFTNTKTFLEENLYFFERPKISEYQLLDAQGQLSSSITVDQLEKTAGIIAETSIHQWTSQTIKERIASVVAASTKGPESSFADSLSSDQQDASSAADRRAWSKSLHHYLRWALTGGQQGPGISETMEILGRDECVVRLKEAAHAG